MKITVYYEDNRVRTTIEVPDEDCEIWVESDYQRRLAAAEDGETVYRRTPQEIMDEDFNSTTLRPAATFPWTHSTPWETRLPPGTTRSFSSVSTNTRICTWRSDR